MCIRDSLYSAVFFTAMLIITKNLYCTCVATSTTSLILCLIINSQMTRKYVGHEEDGRKLQMSHVWEDVYKRQVYNSAYY